MVDPVAAVIFIVLAFIGGFSVGAFIVIHFVKLMEKAE